MARDDGERPEPARSLGLSAQCPYVYFPHRIYGLKSRLRSPTRKLLVRHSRTTKIEHAVLSRIRYLLRPRRNDTANPRQPTGDLGLRLSVSASTSAVLASSRTVRIHLLVAQLLHHRGRGPIRQRSRTLDADLEDDMVGVVHGISTRLRLNSISAARILASTIVGARGLNTGKILISGSQDSLTIAT